MPLESFSHSEPLTLGVELELQLVSLSDFDLTHASSDMLEVLQRGPFPGTVVPEITESMIEVASSVQRAHAPLRARGPGFFSLGASGHQSKRSRRRSFPPADSRRWRRSMLSTSTPSPSIYSP